VAPTLQCKARRSCPDEDTGASHALFLPCCASRGEGQVPCCGGGRGGGRGGGEDVAKEAPARAERTRGRGAASSTRTSRVEMAAGQWRRGGGGRGDPCFKDEVDAVSGVEGDGGDGEEHGKREQQQRAEAAAVAACPTLWRTGGSCA
jgi:hypothetical protein